MKGTGLSVNRSASLADQFGVAPNHFQNHVFLKQLMWAARAVKKVALSGNMMHEPMRQANSKVVQMALRQSAV
jgi:hypothetical protein